MGDLFVEYFGRCMAGLSDAARRGREPSPTTQENCAVAMRELTNLLKPPSGPTLTPSQRQRLMPPPKAKPNILFRSAPGDKASQGMTPYEWQRFQQQLKSGPTA